MVVKDIRVVPLSRFMVDVVRIHSNAEVGVLGVHYPRAELQHHPTLDLSISAASEPEHAQGRRLNEDMNKKKTQWTSTCRLQEVNVLHCGENWVTVAEKHERRDPSELERLSRHRMRCAAFDESRNGTAKKNAPFE
jgi:hypothetical protein